MNEIWRPVVGYEGYYIVSDRGRVRRIAPCPTRYCGHLCKPKNNGNGYLQVQLGRHRTKSRQYVHRLVAMAFLGPCPPGQEVNHKDRNRENCDLSNLEYVTKTENIRHALAARDRTNSLNPDKVKAIRASSAPRAELAALYGVSVWHIGAVRSRRFWKDVA